ncbi:hypothetical protein BC833DRAFT_558321 [Globomyces pollinis-pini]|nr:hypothetical protein BC833DRAFT_558321 [Globomyces pollinis-pini]
MQAVLYSQIGNSDDLKSKHHQFVTSTRKVKIESLPSRFLKAKGHTFIECLKEGFELELYTFEYA